MHVRVASSRQPWKLKRVYERVGDRSSSVLKELHKQKVRSIRVLGLLYLGLIHCPFHIWADNPLLYKVQNNGFGSITWVI